MRVAGNKLKHIADFFYNELGSVYDKPEIEAMLKTAVHHVLGYSSSEMIRNQNENVNQSDLLKLYDCAKDLKKHIPLQYILKETWFYNLKLYVNSHVLIPRPETEELVELILKENPDARSVLDIGTGSGCIPVSIKKNLPNAGVSACDISKEALKVATKNAEMNGVAVSFFETDILNGRLAQKTIIHEYDVIISNPPYIKLSEKSTMTNNVVDHEPHLALFVEGNDDIIFYREIIDLCMTRLSKKGKLYFELNPLTAISVKEYALNSKLFEKVELVKDMSGALRFFKATKF
jgi:release factor glutamine methyltransferase